MKLNHYMAYLRVTVEEKEDNRISGFVYSQRLKEPMAYSDMAALFLQIEELLDEQDFPRAFQRKRTFGKTEKPVWGKADSEDDQENMDEDTVNHARGAIATFAMNVITRQNTSWQGYLDWLDGSPRQTFHSELELVGFIMDGLVS